jgi:hypothetical protein
MRTLCEENGVELILMKAPTNTPQWYWYESWDRAVEAYAQEHGLRYYNFLNNIEEIGLDYTTDTYDQGGHLNLSGAEKLSKYFGKIMTEELDLTDHRGDAKYEQTWTTLCDQYEQIRQTQEKLLEEIQEERAKELFLEGFRLADLKRWKKGFERQPQNGTIAGDHYSSLKVNGTDKRFTWLIPQHEITASQGLVIQNEQ